MLLSLLPYDRCTWHYSVDGTTIWDWMIAMRAPKRKMKSKQKTTHFMCSFFFFLLFLPHFCVVFVFSFLVSLNILFVFRYFLHFILFSVDHHIFVRRCTATKRYRRLTMKKKEIIHRSTGADDQTEEQPNMNKMNENERKWKATNEENQKENEMWKRRRRRRRRQNEWTTGEKKKQNRIAQATRRNL